MHLVYFPHYFNTFVLSRWFEVLKKSAFLAHRASSVYFSLSSTVVVFVGAKTNMCMSQRITAGRGLFMGNLFFKSMHGSTEERRVQRLIE